MKNTSLVRGAINKSTEFFLEASKGNKPGHTPVQFASRAVDVGSAYEDVWGQSGLYVRPTAAESWEIVSDSADDASAGIGAQQVVVMSLNDSYGQQVQVVTMNGVTPVALTGAHFRPRQIICIAAGSSERNVGNITLRVAGAGLTRNVMVADDGQSFDSNLTAPAGVRVFAFATCIYCPKADDITIRPMVTPFGSTSSVSGGDISIFQSGVEVRTPVPFFLPAKTDFKYQVKSVKQTSSVTIIANLMFVEDGF